MSKRVVLTFEVSFMSIMCLDLISCVSPSLVLQRGHRFGLNSLILSILSGIWRAYPLCPKCAPGDFGILFQLGFIFSAFLRLDTVRAWLDFSSSNSFFNFSYFFLKS